MLDLLPWSRAGFYSKARQTLSEIQWLCVRFAGILFLAFPTPTPTPALVIWALLF